MCWMQDPINPNLLTFCRYIVGVHTYNFCRLMRNCMLKQYETSLSETAVEMGKWLFTLIASFYSFIMLLGFYFVV